MQKFPEAKNIALTIIRVIQDNGHADPASALGTLMEIVELLGLTGVLIPLSNGETKSFSQYLEAMRDC